LNFFIFKKDKEFFFEVVRPYIQNKLEKTFVDFFLLEFDEKILEYCKMPKVKELNSFEVCLLIETAMRSGSEIQKKKSKALAERYQSMVVNEIDQQ
jgi:hypothetical protein